MIYVYFKNRLGKWTLSHKKKILVTGNLQKLTEQEQSAWPDMLVTNWEI